MFYVLCGWQVMSDAKPGNAIVLTTHFLDEADALGDRVAILHKGRLQVFIHLFI